MNKLSELLLNTRDLIDERSLYRRSKMVVCKDGYEMSVQASEGHHCIPRTMEGPWDAFEVFCHLEAIKTDALRDLVTDEDMGPIPIVPHDVLMAEIEAHGGLKSQEAHEYPNVKPGAEFKPLNNEMCHQHLDRKAIAIRQGETDSFGCEHEGLCLQCYEEWQVERTKPKSGWCDLHHGQGSDIKPYRDPDEGTQGPVYQACGECRKANIQYHNEEY